MLFTGLIILGLAEEVWNHVEIEAEDYFFPLEPVNTTYNFFLPRIMT